jgi:hypothetical protein
MLMKGKFVPVHLVATHFVQTFLENRSQIDFYQREMLAVQYDEHVFFNWC